MRTITAAGHITEGDAGDDGVKDEPPEPPPPDEPAAFAAAQDGGPLQRGYGDERLRLQEAEARYPPFKQEPYRAASPERRPPQYGRAPRPAAPAYARAALRYGHHVLLADAEAADPPAEPQYAPGPDDARQYAAVLADAGGGALEMIQATALGAQQAVGVAYQPVKYESRADADARPGTYASLQPVASVHGGYAYSGQSPQYAGGYGAYGGGGKELLTLYGGSGAGAGRGDESPPGQLLYRSDPTLSSSSLSARGAHVVYGSVVPQSQGVYDPPPSPSSQQVSPALRRARSLAGRAARRDVRFVRR